ncbi:MAG: multicopper oxidase family protein [Bacteroidales bacterium]|nr:multicopper oxidase family protein [Bacteroidales bacterium]
MKKLSSGIAVTAFLPVFTFCNSNSRTSIPEGSYNVNNAFNPDVDVELSAIRNNIQVLSGDKTGVYSYTLKVLKADNATVENLPGSWLGPVFRVKQGQKIRVRFKNQLPRESVIHWHGLHIPPEMDGHPMYAVDNGEQYVYEFEVNNRPGTYWFHPHPDKITGPQVYQGLAGMFIVEDNENHLPTGEYDIPIIIQDRIFDGNNQLVYLQNNQMSQVQGLLGDRIVVNGNPDNKLPVSKSTYRFRMLNGSNARIYKLAWSDGSDVIVIGTDGGLLPQPERKSYVMLAPGERIEIWKDFSAMNTDDNVLLQSLPFNDGTSMGMGGGMMGGGMMGGGMMQAAGPANGTGFDICAFTATSERGERKSLPSAFQNISSIPESEAVNAASPRQFRFYNQHMQWVINGETFGMKEVADWEKVRLNTTEIWEFINGDSGRGMGMMQDMMQMPHPVHLHGLQFQIVERDVSEMQQAVWETVKDGFIDNGWQDTFLLLPGMKVKIALKFEDYTGIYVYHCHNLEHEDMGMMRNFEVLE